MMWVNVKALAVSATNFVQANYGTRGRLGKEIVEDIYIYIYKHLRLCVGLGCRTQDKDRFNSRRKVPIDHEIPSTYVLD